jgi:hypothetical protein
MGTGDEKLRPQVCCVYDDIPLPNLIPATFVTVERWSAAVAFLMQQPEDNQKNQGVLTPALTRLILGEV